MFNPNTHVAYPNPYADFDPHFLECAAEMPLVNPWLHIADLMWRPPILPSFAFTASIIPFVAAPLPSEQSSRKRAKPVTISRAHRKRFDERILRWFQATVPQVKTFQDRNRSGLSFCPYADLTEGRLQEEMAYHDPSGLIDLLVNSQFMKRYACPGAESNRQYLLVKLALPNRDFSKNWCQLEIGQTRDQRFYHLRWNPERTCYDVPHTLYTDKKELIQSCVEDLRTKPLNESTSAQQQVLVDTSKEALLVVHRLSSTLLITATPSLFS